MNKVTFLIIFCFLLGAGLKAQDGAYTPMFGEKASGWFQYFDLGEAGGKTTLNIYSDGDTTVGGKTYIRLMNDWYYASDDTTYTSVIGFFREDTTERKVYSLNSSTSIEPENVYYDFSKEAGDTLQIGVNTSLVLDSITNTAMVCGDTVTTDSKVYHFRNTGDGTPVTWIEGVGAISGLQANYYNFDCETLDEGLICKMTDDEIVYHVDFYEGFTDCPFEVGSSNQQKPEELTLRLFPNPTHSVLRITGDPSELGNARYRIFNLTGKMMKTGYLDHSRETALDISDFDGGAYIVEIYNKEKNLLTNKKIVVLK